MSQASYLHTSVQNDGLTARRPEPAFPVDRNATSEGLTKREYIAAYVLGGLVANYENHEAQPRAMAARAVAMTDALLEALAPRPTLRKAAPAEGADPFERLGGLPQ